MPRLFRNNGLLHVVAKSQLFSLIWRIGRSSLAIESNGPQRAIYQGVAS
jgi:hypothetical protein